MISLFAKTLVAASGLTALCFCVVGCHTTPTREQQIKHATKKVVKVPFSQRGPLIHQLAKQGELPIDVANGWITEWNEQTLKIQKAEKDYAKQMQRQQKAERSKYRSMSPAQLARLSASYDRNLRDLQQTINDIESLRPRYDEPPPRTKIPQLRSLTVTPAGGGSFYVSDPSVPNSIQYYQKKGNTYYWSE